jgi:hypothetical protein
MDLHRPIRHTDHFACLRRSGRYSDGVAPFRLNDLWGFIDSTGRVVISPQYSLAWGFSHGRAVVYVPGDRRCTVIDTRGQVLFRHEGGEDCRGSTDGVMVVRGPDAKYGYVGSDGSPLTSFMFDWAAPFVGGLAAVRVNGHIGFIDSEG